MSNPSGPSSQEERESLLSAMYDGEVSSGECDLLARRLGRDPALRLKWSCYARTAAVLRGDERFFVSSEFANRVASAIAAEPAHGATGNVAVLGAHTAVTGLQGRALRVRTEGAGLSAMGGSRWWRPAAGAVLAAGVAAASIFVLRGAPQWATSSAQLSPPANGEVSVISREPASYETGSYTVPRALARARASAMPAAQLANYVVAHSEFSNALGRRNLLSALMAGESLGGSANWVATGPGREPSSMGADGSALDEPSGTSDAR